VKLKLLQKSISAIIVEYCSSWSLTLYILFYTSLFPNYSYYLLNMVVSLNTKAFSQKSLINCIAPLK